MSLLSNLVQNTLVAETVRELKELNATMKDKPAQSQNNAQNSVKPKRPSMQTAQYDWNDPSFKDACAWIRDDFYRRHPDITRGGKDFTARYPGKVEGVATLDRLAELNRINPQEFLILYREIFNF